MKSFRKKIGNKILRRDESRSSSKESRSRTGDQESNSVLLAPPDGVATVPGVSSFNSIGLRSGISDLCPFSAVETGPTSLLVPEVPTDSVQSRESRAIQSMCSTSVPNCIGTYAFSFSNSGSLRDTTSTFAKSLGEKSMKLLKIVHSLTTRIEPLLDGTVAKLPFGVFNMIAEIAEVRTINVAK